MLKDVFGRPLEVGDAVIIDAKVAEVFDPEVDDIHLRVVLTNGNGQSIVLRADACAKVLDDAEQVTADTQQESQQAASSTTTQADDDASKAKEKEKPKTRTAK